MEGIEISKNVLNGLKSGTSSSLTYGKYLKLEEILSAQCLQSMNSHQPSHHEHLFIVTHQVYELWFKQIIHELDSVMKMFKCLKEKKISHYEIIKRLNRIILILKLCIEQFAILETMTSTDFLEFRSFLSSASGFQSLQFRLIETKLGLKMDNRIACQKGYLKPFESKNGEYQLLEKTDSELSLFHLIEEWLESFPWNIVNYEKFREIFKTKMNETFEEEHTLLKIRDISSSKIINLKKRQNLFKSLFDDDSQATLNEKKHQMSQKALLGAMVISIYHNEPEFSASYYILNLIRDIDLYLIKWRYYHMLMVQKMIGIQNPGTGGSSGYMYLQSTICDEYQIFIDLANIPIFLIPPELIPPINEMKMTLNNE